jgi:L-fucose mutarotase
LLKDIDPLLTPELLYVLAAMGHGDELVIADANFPADSVARSTTHGRVISLVGVEVPDAVRAVLSLLPLDEFVETPVRVMAAGGELSERPEVQRQTQEVIDSAAGRSLPMGAVERFDFYEAARHSYAVVHTGDRRGWGNVIIKKGVIASDI